MQYETSNEGRRLASFNTASGMDCMQFGKELQYEEEGTFQYRKRYGLHAMFDIRTAKHPSSLFQYRKRYGLHAMEAPVRKIKIKGLFQYRKRYGLHAIIAAPHATHGQSGFNTASGMDCMQYRPSQPLGQLNPEAGFLNGSLFLANRRNPAGFFCRQNRLKTSVNPVISRKLLSTGKI